MAFLYPWGNTQQLNLDWILQKIKELEAEGGADLDEVAEALIAASYARQAYDRSDIVFHDGKLYRANQAIPAPGEAWTPAHWDEILLGDTVSNLVQYVAALSNDQIANSSNVSGTHTSDALNTLKNQIDGITLDSDSVSNESLVAGATVSDALDNLNGAITSVENGLAIIVNGDSCAIAVPSGGYAYLKNNTHGLTEGLYRNKTANAFPTSGGTANSTVFEAVSSGGLNQVTPIALGGTGETTLLASSLLFRDGATFQAAIPANSTVKLSLSAPTVLFLATVGSSPSTCSVLIITGYSGHTNLLELYQAQTPGAITYTQGSGYVEIANTTNSARNIRFNVFAGSPENVTITNV